MHVHVHILVGLVNLIGVKQLCLRDIARGLACRWLECGATELELPAAGTVTILLPGITVLDIADDVWASEVLTYLQLTGGCFLFFLLVTLVWWEWLERALVDLMLKALALLWYWLRRLLE